jgi:hypothetical protein
VLDHLSIGVANLDRAAAFYDAALTSLGYVRLFTSARAVCYGSAGFTGEPPFAILALASGAKPAAPGFTSPLSRRVVTASIASTRRR